ncbi:alpha/beta hydrolase [Pendulispora albinea]|uniref:Alpha/beta hydrolase n=1 Tax=Pendulispora albinea TaxID=2741071 RepID=A0ABZ2M9V0_9BACT
MRDTQARAELPTYDDSAATSDYRARVASAFGIGFHRAPVEAWHPWRGHHVHVDDWSPEGPARGTVILVHGAGGHGRLLAPFALPALDAGFAVRAPDLPGYGLTRVPHGTRLDYATWVDLIADLAREASSLGPVVLAGLSVGGVTALWAAQKAPTVAGVLATTLIDLRDRDTFVRAARAPWLGHLALAAFRFAPHLAGALALPMTWFTPIETLTTDPTLSRALCNDPLIGRRRVPVHFFRSLHTYAPPRHDFALPCPLLLIHPGADTWTPVAMSMPIYERIPTSKELIVLSNGAHAPLESPAYSELSSAMAQFLERAARSR